MPNMVWDIYESASLPHFRYTFILVQLLVLVTHIHSAHEHIFCGLGQYYLTLEDYPDPCLECDAGRYNAYNSHQILCPECEAGTYYSGTGSAHPRGFILAVDVLLLHSLFLLLFFLTFVRGCTFTLSLSLSRQVSTKMKKDKPIANSARLVCTAPHSVAV